MCDKDDFAVVVRKSGELDGGLELAEVEVADLQVFERETPIVRAPSSYLSTQQHIEEKHNEHNS